MTERGRETVAFVGVTADEQMLNEDHVNLPDPEQYRKPVLFSQRHDRLVAAGSLLTVERARTSNPTHVIVPAMAGPPQSPWGSAGALSLARQTRARSIRHSTPADNPCNGLSAGRPL